MGVKMKFRKKPVVIEALRYTGVNNRLMEEYNAFARKELEIVVVDGIIHLAIPTLEGTMLARPNDWIIKGVKGEIYPCKPDIFSATYDAVD